MDVTYTNLVKVPKSCLDHNNISRIYSDLTIYPREFIISSSKDKSPKVIECYKESKSYFFLPISYVKSALPFLNIIDQTILGDTFLVDSYNGPDPNHSMAPPSQGEYMDFVLSDIKKHHTIMFRADTGCGKTYIALNTAIKLKRRTIIVVPLTRLMEQWKNDLLSIGVPSTSIAFFDGTNKKTEGTDFVIANIKSLCKGNEDLSFYNSFGTVIIDEIHSSAAESFSQILMMFSARYRLGLTATPKRLDGAQDVYLSHFGFHTIEANLKTVPVHLHVLTYSGNKEVVSWRKDANDKWYTVPTLPVYQLKNLINDKNRLNLIVRTAKKLYENNKPTLIFADSILYLQHIEKELLSNGVKDVGLFTGERITNNPLPPILIDKTAKKKSKKITIQKQKIKNEEYEYILENSKIILATYQMFKEGISCPRLCAAIDATPASYAEQPLGRITRIFKGKVIANWYTILDENNEWAIKKFTSRMADYVRLCNKIKYYKVN